MDPLSLDWTHLSNATNLVRLLGILIPLATAIITKQVAASGLKSVVTLVLSILAGTIVYLVSVDGGYAIGGFFNAFMNAFLPAIASYYGFLKPTGIAGSFAATTAGFGIGNPPAPAMETNMAP